RQVFLDDRSVVDLCESPLVVETAYGRVVIGRALPDPVKGLDVLFAGRHAVRKRGRGRFPQVVVPQDPGPRVGKSVDGAADEMAWSRRPDDWHHQVRTGRRAPYRQRLPEVLIVARPAGTRRHVIEATEAGEGVDPEPHPGVLRPFHVALQDGVGEGDRRIGVGEEVRYPAPCL